MMTNMGTDTLTHEAKPHIFASWVFNEEFQSYDYRLSMVGNNSEIKDHYSDLENIAATKSGYVYIYCSNESPVNVFFDNLQVVHTKSPILEENHYYSYGLKITAISSKAAGTLQNKYLYQGDFSEFDEDAGYNEFYLRHYDALIGRWTTTDPYEQFASPYLGMGNSPGGMVDPDGGFSSWQGALIGAAAGFALPYAVEALGKIFDKDFQIKNKASWAAFGAFAGSGLGFGIQETYFDANGGTLGMNMKAFYKGLFGGAGLVYSKFDATNQGNVAAYVDVPEIWKGIKMPNLIGSVDGFKFKWMDYAVLKFVTEGLAAANPGYQEMSRDIPHMGGEFMPIHYKITDNILVEKPSSPSSTVTRTKIKIQESPDPTLWNTDISMNSVGGRLKIVLENSSRFPLTVQLVHLKMISMPQSKFTIHFQNRIAIPIRRLKILGIKF